MDRIHERLAQLMGLLVGPPRPADTAARRTANRPAPRGANRAAPRPANRVAPRGGSGPRPAPRRRAVPIWHDLRCSLDCLLVQFPDASRPAQQWALRLGEFLDAARALLFGPAADTPPAAPQRDRLVTRYNAVARASNYSIGIPLLRAPAPPPRPLGLDALSFTVRVRRALRTVEAALQVAGLPQATPGTRLEPQPRPAAHPLCKRPLRARVILWRLYRALAAHQQVCRAVSCSQAPVCTAAQKAWRTYCAAVRRLDRAIDTTLAALRRLESTPGRVPVACPSALAALRAALDARSRARASLAQQLSATRRQALPRRAPSRRTRPR